MTFQVVLLGVLIHDSNDSRGGCRAKLAANVWDTKIRADKGVMVLSVTFWKKYNDEDAALGEKDTVTPELELTLASRREESSLFGIVTLRVCSKRGVQYEERE